MSGTAKALLLGAAFAVTVAAMPAFAMGDRPTQRTREHAPPATSTPEIDAGSGLASAAAVIAALCLAWERRRRSA